MQPEADGMATIGAYLSAEEAAACMATIRGTATGIDGPIGTNQPDVLASLITGTALGAPIPTQIVTVRDGADLLGYGPLTTSHAAWLADEAPKIVLEQPRPHPGVPPRPTNARLGTGP